jgi:positive phototaxis protein PixI
MYLSSLALPQRQKKQSSRNPGEPYLRFQLTEQAHAVFSMQHIQETFVLPARHLTPMPNMPSCMLGLTNRRNRIAWVIDLAHLLGLASYGRDSHQYHLIVIQIGSTLLALRVQWVSGIVRLPSDVIHSPSEQIPPPLLPYLRGCVLHQQETNPELLLVLDAEAIAQSSKLYHSMS